MRGWETRAELRTRLDLLLAAASKQSHQTPALSTLLALLISLTLHLLIILAFFRVPGAGSSDTLDEPPGMVGQTIEVELIVRPLPPKPVPVEPPSVMPAAPTLEIAAPVQPESLPAANDERPEPETVKEQAAPPDVLDPWWGVPRGESTEVRLRRILTAAACPQFIDPADEILAERCAGARRERHLDRNGVQVGTQLAASMAADIEAQAVKKGWAATFVPSNPELEIAEREGTLKAPGGDVFGPWPWESKD